MADIQSNIKVNIDTSDAMASIKALQNQISAFQTQMARSSAASAKSAQNLQRTLLDNVNATGKFNASLTTIRTSTESFTNSLEKNKLSMREYFRYAGGASKSFGKLFKSEFDTIGKVARERVKDLQTQYIKLGRDANGAMQAIKIRPLVLDMESLATKTAIAAQKQQLLNQLLKQGSTNLLNFGKNTQWAGRQLMVGFTIPLGILGQTAAKTFMEMEAQAIKFKRVYGDLFTTTQETDKALKDIRDLASEFTKYGVAATKTMELAAQAAATGKTGAELLAQVNQANRLAVLGNVEQQQALQTTMSLTDAFGTSAQDLGKKINFLNAVENQTITSIEDLTEAIPKAGPVIKQLGGTVEDLTFFLTAMREGGINAAEGANALKSGLASMINPTEKASKFLSGFGINLKGIVETNKGNVKGIVVEFAKALDTLDPLNRAQAIEQLFGKFQFSRLSTLFKNVIGEGTQASRVLEMTSASSAELAKLASSELKKLSESPMYKFQKAVEDIKVQLAPVGEEFLKAITPIVQFGSDVLKSFNNLDSGVKQFIVNLTGIVGGIGPIFLMTFGLIANGAANIIKLFAMMKSGFNNLGRGSESLANQTQYLTTEQLQAASVAASLDQVHSKLRQTFTLEASAVNQLTAAYQRNITASGMTPVVPGRVKKFANGGMIMGPGTGTSDSIPAMVSNGEYVVNAKATKQNLPFLDAINSNKIAKFADGGRVGTYGKGFRNATIYMPESMNTLMGGHSGSGAKTSDVLKYFADAGGSAMAPLLATMAKEMGLELNDPSLQKEWQSAAEALSQSAVSSIGNVSKEFIKDADMEQILVPAFRNAAKNINVAGKSVSEALNNTIENIYTVGQVGTQSGAKGGVGRTAIDARSYKRQGRFAQSFAQNLNPAMFGKHQVASRSRGTKNLFRTMNPATGNWEMATMAHITESITTSTKNLIEKTSAYVKDSTSKILKATAQATVDGTKQETKTASPSKEATQTGKDIGRGFIQGAETQIDDAVSAGKKLSSAVTGVATQSGARRRATSGKSVMLPGVGYVDSNLIYGSAAGPAKPNRRQKFGLKANAIYRGLKSGNINAGGGITKGGFGVGAVAGTAAMFAPPEMQGMLGTISTVSSIIGMFGGVLGKVVPLLLRFAGPIGIAITAITALGFVAQQAAEAERKRVANINRVGKSQLLNASQKSAAGTFYGRDISPTQSILETGLGTGIGPQDAGIVSALSKDAEFRKANKATASRLKDMNTSDRAFTLRNLGMQLRAQGYSNEEVRQQLQAISMMAGVPSNVGEQFGIGTKAGQSGLKTSIGSIGKYASGLGSLGLDFTGGFVRGYGGKGGGQRALSPTTDLGKKNLESAAGGSLAVLQSLKDQYHAGMISANQYRRGVAQLSAQFKKLSQSAKQVVVAKMLEQIADVNLTKVVSGMRNINEQFKLLVMAQNNMISNDLQTLLNNGTRTDQAIAIAKIMAQYKTTDFGKVDEVDGGDKKTALERRLEATGKKIDLLQIALDIISYKEDKINKTYDKRVEALEKVKKANEEITRQQQIQLGLADAISRGDVAAAASAAQEARAYSTSLGLERQGTAIESQRQRELSALTAGGKNRTQIENEIARLQYSDNLYQFGKTKFKFASGGLVPSYFASGGFAMGTDTVPAMLTPGEFVIKKSAVDRIGVNTLTKINGYADGGMVKNSGTLGSSVYNYSISVNVSSNSDANEIAGRVMDSIRRIESQNIRSNRF